MNPTPSPYAVTAALVLYWSWGSTGPASGPLVAHGAKIDEEPEVATQQVKEEAAMEVEYARLKHNYGVNDKRTLEAFFKLFDLWIMLYRLNKADKELREILPAAEWRRDDDAIRAVQALAFTRWKQGRHHEALARFHEMEGWMGKNPALCENIGHTYNALGLHDEAEQYFQDALLPPSLAAPLLGAEPNRGGILLGLAGVQEKRGAYPESLETALAAYRAFRARDAERGWNTSLTAKAAMQVSKLQLKLGRLDEAEEYAREAAANFLETSGDDSPLLAGAMERLGAVLWRRGRAAEARLALHQAYQLQAIKDALDVVAILEVHNQLVDTHIQAPLDRSLFVPYFKVARKVVARVRNEMKQDGNAGVYYKAAGELFVLGDDCVSGRPLLSEAVRLLAVETSVDTTGLVKACVDLMAYCESAGAR